MQASADRRIRMICPRSRSRFKPIQYVCRPRTSASEKKKEDARRSREATVGNNIVTTSHCAVGKSCNVALLDVDVSKPLQRGNR